MSQIEFEIPQGIETLRIDKAIALETHISRSVITEMFNNKDVTLNGKLCKRSEKVSPGDIIKATIPELKEVEVKPQQIDLDIVFEDEYMAVINKEQGMVVHPGAGNPDGTIANALVYRYPDISTVGQVERPGIVHRLDAGTSGLLVIAKTQEVYEKFVEKFSTHDVERIYIALVWGELSTKKGVIDAPIGRSQTRATKMALKDDGKFARTHFEVSQYFSNKDVSLLDISLETGRTHQIRVHLSSIGHPIVGDRTYGGYRQSIEMDRPFLHAHTLQFEHPITSEYVKFSAPLPNDLVSVLKSIETD